MQPSVWTRAGACLLVVLGAVPSGGGPAALGFHRPMPSPDGARIAFTLECGGRHEAALARLDGTDFRLLTHNDVEDWYPQWSPDGSRLAFFRGAQEGDKGRYVIVSLQLASGRETQLTEPGFYDGDPTWSPDGRRIVFNSDRAGNHDVWIMQADGTSPRRLTSNPLSDFSPAVRPDGRRVVYVAKGEHGYSLKLMDLDGANQALLEPSPRDPFKPAWSPDGRALVYFSPPPGEPPGPGVRFRVYRLDLATGAPAALTDGSSSDGDPVWSPDGRQIFFVSDRRGRDELYVMERDGNEPRPLFSDAALERIERECLTARR